MCVAILHACSQTGYGRSRKQELQWCRRERFDTANHFFLVLFFFFLSFLKQATVKCWQMSIALGFMKHIHKKRKKKGICEKKKSNCTFWKDCEALSEHEVSAASITHLSNRVIHWFNRLFNLLLPQWYSGDRKLGTYVLVKLAKS